MPKVRVQRSQPARQSPEVRFLTPEPEDLDPAPSFGPRLLVTSNRSGVERSREREPPGAEPARPADSALGTGTQARACQ